MLQNLAHLARRFNYGLSIVLTLPLVSFWLIDVVGFKNTIALRADLANLMSFVDSLTGFLTDILKAVIVSAIIVSPREGTNKKMILKILYLAAPLSLLASTKILAQKNIEFIPERLDAVWTNVALLGPLYGLICSVAVMTLSLMLATGVIDVSLIIGTQRRYNTLPDYIRGINQKLVYGIVKPMISLFGVV